jgi:membrane-bound lytic murein transglycosylase B
MKKYIWSILIMGILLSPMIGCFSIQSRQPADASNPLERYEPLLSYLETEGIPVASLKQLLQDPRAEYYDNIIVNLYQPPTMNNYSSVYFHIANESYEIDDFIAKYNPELLQAETEFSVDLEAIVAILYVETKLGKIVGNYSVFNILSSLALADSPRSLDNIANYIHQTYHYLDYDKRSDLIELYQEQAIRKAAWARPEFASLLMLNIESHIDILELPGSYAGAFGYPQFMPSNVMRYGIDGDKNGKIDLYSYPDAIMSVGNFLSKKGWSDDNYRQRRALLRYNNSHSYVASVLKTAESIRQDIVFTD